MGDDLGPPPAPKPVTMPPMTEEDQKRLGMCPPVMMPCSPLSGPTMGPNLVFNFYQPYGMPIVTSAPPPPPPPPPPKEEKKECKKVIVQSDPTWNDPRMLAKRGKPIKPNDACLIQ